jgi:ribosomal protein L18
MVKFVMPYKRKREGRTDYRKRLVLLKSGLARLVI